MKYIQGQNRNQIHLFPVSLDQGIDPDNEVRIIDLFVESLSIKDYGFRLRRIISTLGKDQLMKYLKILFPLFLTVSAFFRRKISWLETSFYQTKIYTGKIQLVFKSP